MADTDWKKELDELGDMLRIEHGRHKVAAEEIEAKAKIVIKKGGADAQKQWDSIMVDFKEVGQKINWVKNRYVYIGIGLVLFGLFLHYVIGV